MPEPEQPEKLDAPKPEIPEPSEKILVEGPISTRAELEKVEARVAIGANIVYEAIRREGDDELHRPAQALAWSGLAAGLSMGFSLVAEGLLQAHLPDRPWRPLVAGLGYCLGFLIVVLGRQQLFTENTLTGVLPLLVRRDVKTLLQVLRLWGIVLASNLIGSELFALALAHTDALPTDVHALLASSAMKYLPTTFGATLVRSIFAGWLVALMVWMLPAAETGRVAIIVIVTYIIGVAGFSHVIAGSTALFYLAAVGIEPWSRLFTTFMLPVLVGNIIGGVALVAALGHGQVAGSEG